MIGKWAKRARAEGQALEVTVFVGRAGVTDSVAAEAALQLRTRELVKAKVAREAGDAAALKGLAEDLALRAGADLVEVRGRTLLLARRRPGRGP